MTSANRDAINHRTISRNLLRRFCAGVKEVKNVPFKRFLMVVYFVVMVLFWIYRDVILGYSDLVFFAKFFDALAKLLVIACTVVGCFAILVLMGTPQGSIEARENLQKVGLTNHAGEAPVLAAKKRDKGNPRLTVWEFDPCGIPLKEWEDKQDRVETALNVNVVKITWGEGRKIIRVYTVPAENDFPAMLRWKDEYLSMKNFVLVLGQSLLGSVTVNLAHIPHILLGGSTGSGKSVLLKLLLMQTLRKGAKVYIGPAQ